jgi:ABC-type phosphate/phosphonate transport system substrate-binding protein
MDRIVIVWRSPAIEHGPFALLRTIDEADKAKIESYLVALMTARPAAYDGLNPFYGGGYAPVDPADYAGLAMLAAQDADASRMPEKSAAARLNAAPPDPSAPTASPPAE